MVCRGSLSSQCKASLDVFHGTSWGGTSRFPPGGGCPPSDQVLDLGCLESRSGISLRGTRVSSRGYSLPAVGGPVLHSEGTCCHRRAGQAKGHPLVLVVEQGTRTFFLLHSQVFQGMLGSLCCTPSLHTPSPAGSLSDSLTWYWSHT